MDSKVYKASLLNSYAAADIATDTSVNPNLIRIPGLYPIAVTQIQSVTREAAVSEVQGVWTLGSAVTPVIVALEKYQIRLGNTGDSDQSYNNAFKPYGYTAPATLTSATIDRHNCYSALATQINADPQAHATAYPIVTVAYDAQTGNFAVGETVTDGTTGATGIVISDVDAGATGTLTIGQTGNYSLTFNDNNAITGSVAGAATINGNGTVGVGMRIVDDSGYYYPNTVRKGPNAVMATKGFTSAMLVNTTAGVVSRGQGTYLALDVPVRELLSDNLARGTFEMATNNTPTGGAAYSKYTIVANISSFTGLGDVTAGAQQIQVLYLNEADGDFGATNTALLALNP